MHILILFLLIGNVQSIALTRTKDLPSGFRWGYLLDKIEPSARIGKFWRDACFLDNKIIALNTHYLIALDFKGKCLWIKELVIENTHAEAKIHPIGNDEFIVVLTDSLIRIDSNTGEIITHYAYDTKRRSAFQFTQLLPRQSIFFNHSIYVFLGPQLVSFHVTNFKRTIVETFNSKPKTIPLIYDNKLLLGFQNGFVELFDPIRKKHAFLIQGSAERNFSIRQPVIKKELIFIPTNNEIFVYKNGNLFSKSEKFKNAILTGIDGQVWLREHKSGKLRQIDETLSPLKEITYISPEKAESINTPLIGYHDKLIHIDSIDGKIFVIENKNTLSVKKIILSEDFIDYPPVQLLDQKDSLLLIGAFEGLYLIDLTQIL